MNKPYFKVLIFCLLLIYCKQSYSGESHRSKIYVIELRDDVGPHTRRKIKLGFEEARKIKADGIILHINTYGGTLIDADSIRTMILNLKIPVYAFINNNAASAGALISIACDSIYMRVGANIGAATVVNEKSESMPDKYQSFMRSLMRSTAQAKNRNPLIAEAMVDPDIVVEGVSQAGKVLTFTTEEAIINGFCEGTAENINEVVAKTKLIDPEIITQKLGILDGLIGFLIRPIVSGILIMMIIGGIYFELQTPGIGIPSVIAILGAILYFFPLYGAGLLANWEIIVFVVGIILLILEIFVIPGFGVAGISGIILVLASLVFSLIPNDGLHLHEEYLYMLANAIFVVIVAATMSFLLSIVVAKKILTTNNKLQVALNDVQNSDEGYNVRDTDYASKINGKAVVHSVLRPSGKIIIDGFMYDAITEGDFISKGEHVVVVAYINGQLVVRKG